jgi:hypothetical protein
MMFPQIVVPMDLSDRHQPPLNLAAGQAGPRRGDMAPGHHAIHLDVSPRVNTCGGI